MNNRVAVRAERDEISPRISTDLAGSGKRLDVVNLDIALGKLTVEGTEAEAAAVAGRSVNADAGIPIELLPLISCGQILDCRAFDFPLVAVNVLCTDQGHRHPD